MSAVTIFDIMTPGNVISYWDARKGVQNYMGEMLFPHTKQLGTELTKIGGREGIPVELKASAFDTQTTFRDRLSIETRTQTMPFFKEGMKIDEKIGTIQVMEERKRTIMCVWSKRDPPMVGATKIEPKLYRIVKFKKGMERKSDSTKILCKKLCKKFSR